VLGLSRLYSLRERRYLITQKIIRNNVRRNIGGGTLRSKWR
jgi:hypothetical protein